tara:strand:+ start:2700 stop:3497 length:798 start_codon:yes stop_codon:yes gene_type:complete
MNTFQIIVLGIIQGLTEFLPISSSGHLVLVPKIFGFTDQGVNFDIAVHLGSLFAVVLYFRGDLFLMLSSILSFQKNTNNRDVKLFLYLIIATIPSVFMGYFLSDLIEEQLRNPLIIASTLSLFGVLMWIADKKSVRKDTVYNLDFTKAVIIGIAQSLALVPGTSRSGITMTAALFLGLKKEDAAKFSFLLSIPVILLASCYKFFQILFNGIQVIWSELFIGMVVAFLVAYFSIGIFMRILRNYGLVPFAIYRIILGIVILYLFLG